MVSDAVGATAITIALFLPLSAADLYLSADHSGILPVNATAISFAALSCVFGLVVLVEIARDGGRRLCSHYRTAAPILLVFALLTMVQLSGGLLRSANSSEGGKYVYLSLYNFVLLFLSLGIASAPTFQRHYRGIVTVCLLGAAVPILIDVAYPQTFSVLKTRPAGFEQNANHAAAIVVILAISAVDWSRSRVSDMFLWLISGLAVVATLSRGGMAMLGVVFVCYISVLARSGPSGVMRNVSLLAIAVAGVVAFYSVSNLGDTVYSSENNRVQLLAKLLSGNTATVLQDSRVALASSYVDLIAERPLLGHGTGFVMSQDNGPHNMFLTLWVENGVVGLSAYSAFLIVCLWYFQKVADVRGQLFGLSLALFSLLTHNLLTTRSVIVGLGLLSLMAAFRAMGRSTSTRSPVSPCRTAGFLVSTTKTDPWPARLETSGPSDVDAIGPPSPGYLAR